MTGTPSMPFDGVEFSHSDAGQVRFLPFDLPASAEAAGPPEALGRARDDVRLAVASTKRGLVHTAFTRLPEFLEVGDLLVVNDSATLPAALGGRVNGLDVRVHVSVPVRKCQRRLVELRIPAGPASREYRDGKAGDLIHLHGGGLMRLIAPRSGEGLNPRLWEASFDLHQPLHRYLGHWGQPIRYSYVTQPWDLRYYQTIFAKKPGSTEMPSAARPFSKPLVRRLAAMGVGVCPITLHTGVASLERHELPYPEPYSVTASAAGIINSTRAAGGRVIAVGTTVVRALETVCDAGGSIRAGHGFTELVITPDRPVRSVQGLITGWHEPKATHLMMLEAIAGLDLLTASYADALGQGYQWHEFGDSHLILP